jgi:hypothetical protein
VALHPLGETAERGLTAIPGHRPAERGEDLLAERERLLQRLAIAGSAPALPRRVLHALVVLEVLVEHLEQPAQAAVGVGVLALARSEGLPVAQQGVGERVEHRGQRLQAPLDEEAKEVGPHQPHVVDALAQQRLGRPRRLEVGAPGHQVVDLPQPLIRAVQVWRLDIQRLVQQVEIERRRRKGLRGITHLAP